MTTVTQEEAKGLSFVNEAEQERRKSMMAYRDWMVIAYRDRHPTYMETWNAAVEWARHHVNKSQDVGLIINEAAPPDPSPAASA